MSAARDITERQQAEAKFHDLLESSPEAMVIVDRAGQIVMANAQTAALFGYAPEEVLGQSIEALVPRRFARKVHGVRREGTAFPAEVKETPLEAEEGLLAAIAIRDATERQRLREARRRSRELAAQKRRIEEANRLKSAFLASVSHELRTPLNGIIGFAELLYDEKAGPMAPEHKEYLGYILTSARHLLQLINDVLDLAKVEAGKMAFRSEPVDVRGLVDEVRDVLAAVAGEKRVRITAKVAPALTDVVADPARLKQVLYNYLSNAIKFTPPGGRVTVRVAAEGADRFRLEVEDTGVGIRPEDIDHLFVEFQQLEASDSGHGSGASRGKKPKTQPETQAEMEQGTGLGLALTKRIVEALGGTVGVHSTLGKGSRFFAVLPRRAGAREAPAGETPPRRSPAPA